MSRPFSERCSRSTVSIIVIIIIVVVEITVITFSGCQIEQTRVSLMHWRSETPIGDATLAGDRGFLVFVGLPTDNGFDRGGRGRGGECVISWGMQEEGCALEVTSN